MARPREPLAYGLYLLGRRGRTVRELQSKLIDKQYPPAAVTTTINRLKQLGLLNDAVYARNYARDKIAIYRRGRYRISQELRQKGVAQDLIDEALGMLDESDDVAAAVSLLTSRARVWQDLDGRKRFERSVRLLQRRGFGAAVIRAAINQAGQEKVA